MQFRCKMERQNFKKFSNEITHDANTGRFTKNQPIASLQYLTPLPGMIKELRKTELNESVFVIEIYLHGDSLTKAVKEMKAYLKNKQIPYTTTTLFTYNEPKIATFKQEVSDCKDKAPSQGGSGASKSSSSKSSKSN